jgi:DNA-binding transcriptional regulator LsrR (DeoR family)
VGPDETVQLALVAHEYYVSRKSRVDIADELGISRFKVAKMLDQALELGIVTIKVQSPSAVDLELSNRLKARFKLRRALAVATPNDLSSNVRDALGKVTAELLSEIVTESDVLGLASGRTLMAMSDHLGAIAKCDVVQLAGMSGLVQATSNALVARVSEISGGKAYSIYGPLIVSDSTTADSLKKEPSIAAAFGRFRDVTKAVIAFGSWNPRESQVSDAVSDDERQDILNKGVRADVCATLLTDQGEEISVLEGRSLAITLQQLRAIPEVIVVAGGLQKTDALRAVLRTGIVTSLVTDARMAERLIEHH